MDEKFYADDAYNYLVKKGAPPHIAAGMVGNLFQESGMNPRAINPQSGAYGLGQWLGPRKTGLLRFANSKGSSPHDPYLQMDYMLHELGSSEGNALKALNQSQDTPQAAIAFSHQFERAGKDERNDARRIQIANQIHSRMNQGGMIPASFNPQDDGMDTLPEGAQLIDSSPDEGLDTLPEGAQFIGGSENGMQQNEGQKAPEKIDKRKAFELLRRGTQEYDKGLSDFTRGMQHSVGETARGLGQIVGLTPQSAVDEARAAMKLESPDFRSGDLAGLVGQSLLGGRALQGAASLANAGRFKQGLQWAGEALEAPKTIMQGAASGAAIGGSRPVSEGESRADNAINSAGIGAAGSMVGKALGSMTVSPQARKLMAEGVELTPGQMVGGIPQRLEEMSQDLFPLTGEMVRNARMKSFEGYNLGSLKKIYRTLGDSLPSDVAPGHQAFDETAKRVSTAFDDAYSGLKFVADKKFMAKLAAIKNQFGSIENGAHSNLFDQATQGMKFDKSGVMTGSDFNPMRSKIIKMASNFKHGGGYSSMLADELQRIDDAFTENALRHNPGDKVQSLKNARRAFAMLKRVESATSAAANNEGLYSGAQLMNAERTAQGSSKKSIARGKGLMQNWAQAGNSAIGQKVPDSGTARRLISNLQSAAATGGLASLFGPQVLLPIAAQGIAYSKPGLWAIRNALEHGDPMARALAERTGLFTNAFANSGE